MLNKYKKFKELKKQAKTMETELATVISEGSAAWNKVKVTNKWKSRLNRCKN